MRLLVKAVRAQQLYLPNNPMYRATIDALRSGFAPVWAHCDELTLTVAETELKWSGARVLAEGVKSSDNLAWLFYKDGIRAITIAKGAEESDIVRFLEIVARARKATVDDDDLVTMLWEADLATVKYKYVDLIEDGGGGPPLDGDEPAAGAASAGGGTQPSSGVADPEAVRRGTEEAVLESRAGGGVVNMADFDATLYFLDEKEADYLKQELAREYSQDLRVNIVAGLLDVFELQAIDEVRAEVLDDLEMMLAFMLAAGSFQGVGYLLTETAAAAERATDLSPDLRARVADLGTRLSAPDAVAQLLESLDDAPELPSREALSAMFDRLQPAALGPVFSWLPKIRSEQLRGLINDVAGRLASMNTADLVKLIQSPDTDVSSEAIRRAGALRTQAAVLALGKVVADPDPRRRLVAAQALSDIGSPGAMQALERCLGDADRDVRILAARSMAARSYKAVLAKLETIIRGKEIREADVTEKTAFFECYGAICGDAGVAHLDGILNGKGFLGRREDPDLRAAAALGLGRINSARARDALQKAAGEKDVVVRNAVMRATRGAAT